MEFETAGSACDLLLEAVGHSGAHPESVEVVAALLRVAASFHPRCSASALISDVVSGLDGFGVQVTKETVEDVLQSLISYGDLIERESTDPSSDHRRRLLYPRPPSFVMRPNDEGLLLGIAELDELPLNATLRPKLVFRDHTRRISATGLADQLRQCGFVELDPARWCEAPRAETWQSYKSRFDRELDESEIVRAKLELQVLDASKPVRYYKGRWGPPGTLTGRFICRRPRLYGNPLWSYAQLEDGKPTHFMDILETDIERPCDIAWRLQCAIDASRGSPQVLTVTGHETDPSRAILAVHSPIPQWAERRLTNLGVPVCVQGTLISYEIDSKDVPPEVDHLKSLLWLNCVDWPNDKDRS